MVTMAHRIRWSDDDHHFGPFLYAKDKYRNFACVLGSGDDEDYPGCRLRVSVFGHTVILVLPPIIKPFKRKIYPESWDEATVARLGRNWYFDCHEREFGFSYSTDSAGVGGGGFLRVFLGPQTMDSSTTKSWSYFTPWNNWTHVRHTYYDLAGNPFWDEPQNQPWAKLGTEEWRSRYDAEKAVVDSCPTKTFSFTDFDGEQLTAKTRIEEREWRLGTGWFKWLGKFKKPIIHRSLDLDFSGEVGRRKGSWKGGTTGHSIEMLPGELHEAAFRRYCDGDDRREGKRDMKFGGEIETIQLKARAVGVTIDTGGEVA
jgi:hypothetical protein